MKLTEKCKDDFEKWYKKTYSRELVYSTMNETLIMTLPMPFVYGVYVDFFNSSGINILNPLANVYTINGDCKHRVKGTEWIVTKYASTNVKAIEKANKMYNENNT